MDYGIVACAQFVPLLIASGEIIAAYDIRAPKIASKQQGKKDIFSAVA